MRSCEAYQEMISALLDGELTAEETAELQAHIAGCGECGAMYAAFRALGALEAEPVPPTLHSDIMAKIAMTRKAMKTQRTLVRLRPIFTAAACLVVVVGSIFAMSTVFRAGGRKSDAAAPAPAEAPSMKYSMSAEAPADEAEPAPEETCEDLLLPEAAPAQDVYLESANAETVAGDSGVGNALAAVQYTEGDVELRLAISEWQPEFFVGTVTDAGTQDIFSLGETLSVRIEEATEIRLPDGGVFVFDFDAPNADACPLPAGSEVTVRFSAYEYAPGNGVYNCLYAAYIAPA